MNVQVDSRRNVATTPCLLSALRRASRAVTQLYDLVLAPSRLKATQFFILRELDHTGELAQHEFAERYGVAVETLSRRFRVLRRKGLLTFRVGPRRERIYQVTPEGKEILSKAFGYWNIAEYRLQTTLGTADWTMLRELSERSEVAAREAERLRTNNRLANSA